MIRAGERRPVRGYEGLYEVSAEGVVYRMPRRNKEIITVMSTMLRDGAEMIRLTDRSGNRKEIQVSRIVACAFLGMRGLDWRVRHKNGFGSDNFVNNLEWIRKSDLGKQTGGMAKSKPVRKIDPKSGEILEFYKSAREAGRKNFMSGQTVCDHCNKDIRKARCAPDGFVYEWDDGGY